ELVLFLRKDLTHQKPEASVKFGIAAARLGEQETSLLDEVAQVFPGDLGKLWCMVTVEEDDRGLKQIRNRGEVRIDDLPGQQVFPVTRDNADDVTDVVDVIIPVSRRSMAQFVDQHRRTPLGQKEQREAGCQDLISLDQ